MEGRYLVHLLFTRCGAMAVLLAVILCIRASAGSAALRDVDDPGVRLILLYAQGVAPKWLLARSPVAQETM